MISLTVTTRVERPQTIFPGDFDQFYYRDPESESVVFDRTVSPRVAVERPMHRWVNVSPRNEQSAAKPAQR